jgi:hypothetical protein
MGIPNPNSYVVSLLREQRVDDALNFINLEEQRLLREPESPEQMVARCNVFVLRATSYYVHWQTTESPLHEDFPKVMAEATTLVFTIASKYGSAEVSALSRQSLYHALNKQLSNLVDLYKVTKTSPANAVVESCVSAILTSAPFDAVDSVPAYSLLCLLCSICPQSPFLTTIIEQIITQTLAVVSTMDEAPNFLATIFENCDEHIDIERLRILLSGQVDLSSENNPQIQALLQLYFVSLFSVCVYRKNLRLASSILPYVTAKEFLGPLSLGLTVLDVLETMSIDEAVAVLSRELRVTQFKNKREEDFFIHIFLSTALIDYYGEPKSIPNSFLLVTYNDRQLGDYLLELVAETDDGPILIIGTL